MRWVLSHQSPEQHRWILRDADESAQFTYNLHLHSFRIKARTARLFFLEQTGFLHKKVLLRSEYGVVVAEAQAVGNGRMGNLLFDNRKFSYRLDGQGLLLFDKAKKPVMEIKIECRPDTDRLELMAFVFIAAWMAASPAVAADNENLLVA